MTDRADRADRTDETIFPGPCTGGLRPPHRRAISPASFGGLRPPHRRAISPAAFGGLRPPHRRAISLAAILGCLLAAAPVAHAQQLDVPVTTFTLPNGLDVIVHEDHSAPVVSVNIWYHVGSGRETAGR
ncbi:MAG TPA: hypothetical protein VFK36_01675, partial [Gemmatimonadales bacterium]|nr:hypothetical protein [Gemmatimonadales bacterium]